MPVQYCASKVHVAVMSVQCRCGAGAGLLRYGAGAVPVWCRCGAGSVQVRCRCGAGAVQVQCRCGVDADPLRHWCSASAVQVQCQCGAGAVGLLSRRVSASFVELQWALVGFQQVLGSCSRLW